MLAAGEVAGVAVSGGADSVSLLLLLHELRAELGIQLVVLHFNHRLRGTDSDEDERFVAANANRLNLEFITGSEDVAALARKARLNLEDAARNCRYAFFARLVEDRRVARVAVAHTADDQAETVLGKIIRGTGLAGLGGIYPVAGHIVRPLIEIRRAELRDFLRDRGIAWREDSTNVDQSRLRARIRSKLLPLLEDDFQPAIVSQLSYLAALSRQDEESWTTLVEERFQTLVRHEDDSLRLGVRNLLTPLEFPAVGRAGRSSLRALSARLVRRVLQELKGDLRGFTSRHVEDVLHLATASTSGHKVELPFGIVVERCFDELWFRAGSLRRPVSRQIGSAPERGFQRLLDMDARHEDAIDIPEIGTRLRLKVIDWPTWARDTKLEAPAADFGCLRPPLVLRNWLPGDAFRPEGRLRAHKLARLMLARRIALRERRHWPVLTSNGKVVWARGFAVAHEFAAGDKTRKALVIFEEPI